MTHETYVSLVRRKIVDTASAMLRGEMSFIEGGRRLSALSYDAELPEFDSDVVPFIVINSECDALPLGDVRQHWAPEALVRLQPEIDRAEKWAKETAGSHCQNLIDRFGPDAVRRQIAETARAMLKDEMSFIEGAHRIVRLAGDAQLPESDPDLAAFQLIGIEYETLPPTDGREHWAPDVLAQSFPEIAQAEEWARQRASSHCQSLIDRFSAKG